MRFIYHNIYIIVAIVALIVITRRLWTWEKDIQKVIIYIRTQIDYNAVDYEVFGKILMKKLKEYYKGTSDIKYFTDRMYNLWEDLPGQIQDIEPFWTLCYADDPLSWGDEEQTKSIYENMMNFYED